MSNLRPWDELTALEKREAIAQRLGWDGPKGDAAIRLPEWPTNDGLAFTEVWPKLFEAGCEMNVSLTALWTNVGGRGLLCAVGQRKFYGRTWADAICRAAYELLPDPTEATK